MKILSLNTADNWGGAARAAFRLNQGIRGLGLDAQMLVQRQERNDANGVIALRTNPKPAKIINGLRELFDTLPVRFYPKKPIYNFTPAYLPDRLGQVVATIAPDILHLHWLAAGFCRLETLKEFEKPLIWTLHDSWALTGGCHVPAECTRYHEKCGACPVLGSTKEDDISRRIWQRKKNIYQQLNLTIVTPSRWLADCAKASTLLKGLRVEIIPNGLDLNFFKTADKHFARKELGLPLDKKLILFGAIGSTSDRNKGFHLLMPALRKVSKAYESEAIELVIFGASSPADGDSFGMNTHYLGHIDDDDKMALLYAASDVFVSPSMLENLPNTVMEAMACGTPCIAFRQGGLADLIEHDRTGYLADPYKPEDMAAGIVGILGDDVKRKAMALYSRQYVEEHFDIADISRRYADLYQEIAEPQRNKRGEQ